MSEGFNFKEFLMKVTEKGASDIHLHVDEKPYVRINGSIIRVNYPELSENDILAILEEISPLMIKKGDADGEIAGACNATSSVLRPADH